MHPHSSGEIPSLLCHDGSEVMLGHLVAVPVPSGTETGRVVMLGDTYTHLDVDPDFLKWVVKDRVLKPLRLLCITNRAGSGKLFSKDSQ